MHGLAAHLPSQEDVQAVCPQAELRGGKHRVTLLSKALPRSRLLRSFLNFVFRSSRLRLTSVLEGAIKFRLYSSTSYVMLNARSSTSCRQIRRRQLTGGEHERKLRRDAPLTLFCLPLFSFMWGQSLPVSRPLISATETA